MTEIVTWYGIAAWNGLGDACYQYLKKGRQVMVEGTRLEATAWVGRDGNLYTKLELTANEVKFLGGNGDGDGNGDGNGGGNGGGGNGRGRTAGSRSGQTRQTRKTRQQQPSRQQQAPRQQQPRQQQPPRQQQAHEYIPDNPEDIPF